ncbi:hypothetical protein LguiB_030450 [Lonicera macranthoides]
MCADRRAWLVPQARPKCRWAQQFVSEPMVDPRTCEAVSVARLGGVRKNSVKPKVISRYTKLPGSWTWWSLWVYLETCALTKGGRSCRWALLSGDLHGQFKGGFMVDYGICLGGAEPVLVQGGAKFKGEFMVDYGIGLGGAGQMLVEGGAKVDWFDPRWRLLRMLPDSISMNRLGKSAGSKIGPKSGNDDEEEETTTKKKKQQNWRARVSCGREQSAKKKKKKKKKKKQ